MAARPNNSASGSVSVMVSLASSGGENITISAARWPERRPPTRVASTPARTTTRLPRTTLSNRPGHRASPNSQWPGVSNSGSSGGRKAVGWCTIWGNCRP